MTTAMNPTTGEDLIVGVAFVSDAGPSNPMLIQGQKEFLSTYASGEVTEEYLKRIDSLYADGGNTASTMWANAYRLAGSVSLLCVRASKADNLYFAKPLDADPGENTYVLKDGELLKRIEPFKFVVDLPGDEVVHDDDGWSIDVRGVGIFGNRVTDEGAQYDYHTSNLVELVDKLNETSKFFSPKYDFYTDETATTKWDSNSGTDPLTVLFDEVYVAAEFLNPDNAEAVKYLSVAQKDWTHENPNQHIIDLNDTAHSGFEASEYFALNVYNSRSNLKVRIRRFNHDAVTTKKVESTQLSDLTASTPSPYNVLKPVLDTFTKYGTEDPNSSVLARDFFEIAVLDPSTSEAVEFFNIGNYPGRGDLDAAEVNELLNMISLELPDDLHDLGLNYYGYITDDKVYRKMPSGPDAVEPADITSLSEIAERRAAAVPEPWLRLTVGSDISYYQIQDSGRNEALVNISVDPNETSILTITNAELLKALDKIMENEVYVVEGLSDLGNPDLSYQNYMANMAIAEDGNYFYPISTINSTNYMTIGASAAKILADSYKLYMSAPWDVDTATLGGTKFFASPSVLYWEGVAQNYRDGRPYASLFGQTYGKVGYQRPVCEFNKKQRELLLSKKVNTVMWNPAAQIWQMNDNYTKQSENTIMNDEGNVRMGIHIAKVQPQLLAQFIGKKITEKLCADVKRVEEFWINNNIMNLNGNTPDEVQVFCNYDEALARQNKIRVVINIRFARALKFVTVVDRYFDTGMDISSAEF